MNFTYFLTHCRKTINKQTYEYSEVKNLKTMPINIFTRFPSVYLIIFNNGNTAEMESAIAIRLAKMAYSLTHADLHYLVQYDELCEKYNNHNRQKASLKKKLNKIEAEYKYHKYVTNNKPLVTELKPRYMNAKQTYAAALHFNKTDIILLSDLFHYFLSKV